MSRRWRDRAASDQARTFATVLVRLVKPARALLLAHKASDVALDVAKALQEITDSEARFADVSAAAKRVASTARVVATAVKGT